MASRKFIYLNQETGVSTEQATTDCLSVGSVVLNDGGQAAEHTAGETLINGDVVYESSDSTVSKADSSDVSKSKVIGVVNTGALVGNNVVVTQAGPITVSGESFTVNAPIFLSTTGRPTETFPTSGKRVIRLGYAKSSTILVVDIVDLGKRS